MGFNSQSGHVGLRTQASKGSYADPGAAAPDQGVFMRRRGGALGANRELLIPDPEIGGNRDIPDAYLGAVGYSGEYDFYCRPESFATLAYGAFGAVVESGAAGTGFLHTITPADTIPWLSVEERIGNGLECFRYTDAKVNTLHLEAEANGYLQGTVGLIALSQLAGATPTIDADKRWDTAPMMVGTNIVVTYNGVDLKAKSFSLDVNNNLEDDDFRLGSLTLGDAVEKRRELTMGVTIRPEDATLWRQATYGSSAATSPIGGAAVKEQAVVTITSYEDIPGANVGVKYVMTFTVPKATIKPFRMDTSGDDVIQHDLEIQALRPLAGTALVTTTVLNSYATVA